MYIQSEAGITEYSNLAVTDVGSANENGKKGGFSHQRKRCGGF
jgi:hypothetical protein